MNKIYLQLSIALIAILLSITGFIGFKKYIDRKYNSEENKLLAYNDLDRLNNSKNLIEKKEEPTTNTTEEITTTKVETTTATTTTTTPIINKDESFGNDNLIIKRADDKNVVYDGLTLTELTDKLNKNLNSTLSNTGSYFANYYVKTGLDPYLALAIVLHETGCKWTCSTLVRDCGNIGGIKGSPSCNGTSYKKYNNLEEGINGYLDLLYTNYYSQGLTTPELINPKYAGSPTWSAKINSYIETIRAS